VREKYLDKLCCAKRKKPPDSVSKKNEKGTNHRTKSSGVKKTKEGGVYAVGRVRKKQNRSQERG